MNTTPTFLMVDPGHFDVSYAINPWMTPDVWTADPKGWHDRALAGALALKDAIEAAGGRVEWAKGLPGLPDMVFPANAAVVLDGRAITSRFRYPERRGEEAPFLKIFEDLAARGLLSEVRQMPEGVFQEGAGDCVWDAVRGHFWGAFGPRSSRASIDVLQSFFGREVVPLELASDRCYHLDVGFLTLSGGEVFYLPDALTPQARATLHARVPADLRMEATEDDLRHFNINAVNIGRTVIMSTASPALKARLKARGYEVVEVDVTPFMMSGGATYCMTLRLDRTPPEAPTSAS